MKYLILIITLVITTLTFADDYHQFSARYRTSPIDTISHLDIKNDVGVQFDFRRDLSDFFYTGSIYATKANVSDTQGFTAGLGYSLGSHSLSLNYFGEQNYEKWRIQEGECKACNLDWINSNWRSNYYIEYEYQFRDFKLFTSYHHVVKDRDELLDNRYTVGLEYAAKFIDRPAFFRVMYDQHLTTFNLGFTY